MMQRLNMSIWLLYFYEDLSDIPAVQIKWERHWWAFDFQRYVLGVQS